ncbi:MAG TPA: hypothetical protein VF627_09105 [Abditibacterium sp.]|jgi:hypothetical protein
MNPTNPNQEHSPTGEELNPAEPSKTPLQMVKEMQAAQQENREVLEHRPDASPEVPGAGKPSDRRKHPQRQMYGSGTDES